VQDVPYRPNTMCGCWQPQDQQDSGAMPDRPRRQQTLTTKALPPIGDEEQQLTMAAMLLPAGMNGPASMTDQRQKIAPAQAPLGVGRG
jgi:hypothetical protein